MSQTYRQNLKLAARKQEQRDCMICRISSNDIPLIQLSPNILRKKYFEPYRRAQLSIHMTNRRPQYIQTKILIDRIEHLQSYNNFSMTVGKIRSLILERVKQDRIEVIHLHGPYNLFINRYRAIRRLKNRGSCSKQPQKVNSSGVSTQGQQKSDKKMNGIGSLPKKKEDPNRDSETTSMRRLTRNLSLMTKKFDEYSEHHPHRSRHIFEMLQFATEGLDITRLELQEKLSKQIGNNISMIQDKERLQTNPECVRKYEQNYGINIQIQNRQIHKILEADKKMKKSANKDSKKVMKQNGYQRIYTDYDCQVIKKVNKKTLSKKSIDKESKITITSLTKKSALKKSLSKSRVARAF